MQTAVDQLKSRQDVHRLFIIGGGWLYRETLNLSSAPSLQADRVLLTRIHEPDYPDCDVFLPDFLDERNGGSAWKRASHDELVTWADLSGFDIPPGVQETNGIKFEFQMWVKS